MILLSDVRLNRIVAVENGEPFVDMANDRSILVDGSRSQIGNMTEWFACVRSGVYRRLLEAQRQLPSHLCFVVKEGFRPISLQTKYYHEYLASIKAIRPQLSAEELVLEVSKYVAPPEVAPHSTGGAVDIALSLRSGEVVDMGSNFKADPADSQNTCYFDAQNISTECRKYRNLLKECMESVDFVNYPTEWWHWSHGDKYWALLTGRSESKYEKCEGPFFAE
jgi:zinc D-Ala-D-Ala dipeptidase